MFRRLVEKELLIHLLDSRFLVVLGLCILLSALSVCVGGRDYVRDLQEHNAVSESNRRAFQETSLDKGRLYDLIWLGYAWKRPPEPLRPLVFGLSGTLGQEVQIRYQQFPVFEASGFETDSIRMLFSLLDFAFVVKVVLSLCVLLFTYDAVCGEKEQGTLRLYASFPVSRATLALAKLVGSTVSVLLPFLMAFSIAATVLALSPQVGLAGEDWGRVASMMVVFALYLAVFAAFGLFLSALTHRRMTAFLGLLGLWAVWVFVIPNLALDAASRLAPIASTYDLQRRTHASHLDARVAVQADVDAYVEHNRVEDWRALTEAERESVRRAFREARHRIETARDDEHQTRLRSANAEWRRGIRRQHRLAMTLSAVSPFGAVSVASMDLARTGPLQQQRFEDALYAYHEQLGDLVRAKRRESFETWDGVDLGDFTWFSCEDRGTLRACLSRNAFHILNLALLAILGFAGAYVVFLRYDVR